MEYTTNNGFRIRDKVFGDMKVKQILSPRAAPQSDFLVASVTHLPTHKELWCFRKHMSATFTGLAHLHEINGEVVILLATRKILYAVLPILDLPVMQQVGEEFLGGRNLRELIALKATLARNLNLTPFWTEREMLFQKVAYTTKSQNGTGTKVRRKRKEDVTVEPLTSKQARTLTLFRTLIINEIQEEILVLTSIEEVQSLHKHGVDNGTLVMCPKPGTNGDERYLVLCLTKTAVVTVTEMVRQSTKK